MSRGEALGQPESATARASQPLVVTARRDRPSRPSFATGSAQTESACVRARRTTGAASKRGARSMRARASDAAGQRPLGRQDKRPDASSAGRLETSAALSRGGANHTRSIAIAMPWPTPMHIVQSAKRPPVRCS
ncbi:hypothetical protein AQ871_19330 [Burkholderia pseudomallei]|nr:hypothetical protein AQ871_19330 [Burkholderia pseudomallei]